MSLQTDFIAKIAPWAQEDWPVHQILPSLTLAQGILCVLRQNCL